MSSDDKNIWKCHLYKSIYVIFMSFPGSDCYITNNLELKGLNATTLNLSGTYGLVL